MKLTALFRFILAGLSRFARLFGFEITIRRLPKPAPAPVEQPWDIPPDLSREKWSEVRNGIPVDDAELASAKEANPQEARKYSHLIR